MNAPGEFLKHLPPVHWSGDNDPSGYTSRLLKVFERILWGVRYETEAARLNAPILSAAGNLISVATVEAAIVFLPGDIVTIEGTTERVVVDNISGQDVILTAALSGGPYGAGQMRLADLAPGQTRIRVTDPSLLWSAAPLSLKRGADSEYLIIDAIDGPIVYLRFGLSGSYSLAANAMRVRVVDGVQLGSPDRDDADSRWIIERIHELFNPWRAPLAPRNAPSEDYLSWFAQWVALELHPEWTEFQKRRLISDMVQVYKQRGLKKGLHTYLGIYAVSEANPRIAIDDGTSLYRVERKATEPFALHEIAHASDIQFEGPMPNGTETTGLGFLTGFAADSANTYFACDEGEDNTLENRPPALWQLSSTGAIPFAIVGTSPMPVPAPIHVGAPFEQPAACTTDATDRVSVVDYGTITGLFSQDSAIFRFAPPGYALTTVINASSVPAFSAVRPVDLISDASGAFIVLDRGAHLVGDPPSGPSNQTRIIVITEGPLAQSIHALPIIAEATALASDGASRFIVADAQDQSTTTPAELFRIDPAGGWTATPLLAAVAPGDNPLVYPVGIIADSPTSFLICDRGYRNGVVMADALNRTIANDPKIFQVDIAPAIPTITPVCEDKGLVNPTSMRRDAEGEIIIADLGEVGKGTPTRNWRARHGEFGVVTHFSSTRPTTHDERRAVLRGVLSVLDEAKPSHATYWIDF